MRRHSLLALVAGSLLAAGAVGADEGVREAAASFGLLLASGEPTSIQARTLEASRDDEGREHVVFQGDVAVEQGALRIRCDRLEATYPLGESGGPERLVARGRVRIRQGDGEARCQEAVFESSARRAVCRGGDGNAVLRRGDSVVEGTEIVFDLADSTVRVSGGAVVHMNPRQDRR